MSTTMRTEPVDDPDWAAVRGAAVGAEPPDEVPPGVEPDTAPVDPGVVPAPALAVVPPVAVGPPDPPVVDGEPVVGVVMVIRLSSDVAVPDRQFTGAPPTACQVSPTTWMSSVG